jgi:hypothetical protein
MAISSSRAGEPRAAVAALATYAALAVPWTWPMSAHPYARSLAFTESLLPEAVQAAPVLLAGGGRLLAHNVVALLTFPLCGLGAREGRTRHLVALAVFSTLQALSSGYYALALGAGMAAALAAEAPVLHRRRTVGRVVITLAATVAVIELALLPYAAARSATGFSRSRQEMVHWSARWSSYLDPGDYAWLPHVRWLHEQFDSTPLYPGTVPLALAAAGALGGPAVRLPLLLTAVGVVLSFGPEVRIGPWQVPGPYELIRTLPLLDRLRTPARLGVLAMLGSSLLVAAGWRRLMAGRRFEPIVAIALAASTALEVYPLGLAEQIRPAPAIPESARWLAAAPPGPVLELPWDHQTENRGALYLYWSTAHWQRLVNGWGAYSPPGPFGLGVVGHRWPSAYTAKVFRDAGIRYVVVHLDAVSEGQRRRLMQEPPPEGTRLVFDSGWERIYELLR